MEFSKYQEAVFQNAKSGTGNTILEAYAGAAKTTTIVEASKNFPKTQPAIFTCFNKSIQQELSHRVPQNVDTSTMHSLGLKGIKKAFGSKVFVDDNKEYKICKQIVDDNDLEYDVTASLKKALGLCQNGLIDGVNEIDNLIDRFDLEIYDCSREQFIQYVQKALTINRNQKNVISFNNMVYFPAYFNLKLGNYDFVMCDEAQDFSATQHKMISLLCSKKARVFAVGDSYQAIYGFRMAMPDSMNVLKQNLNAQTFQLPITYRCPLLVVKEAQVYVPGLQAAPWAKEGIVGTLKDDEMYKNLKIGDVILSRTNAPMIGICLKLIKAGVPANIEGRDIGQNLISLIDKSKADSVSELIDWVENWRDMEVARLMKKDQDATHINDKAECVIALCEGFKSVSDIRNNIEKLFKDSDNGRIVLLSTTHKAKGKEYDRVFILKDTYRPYQNQEEKNLMYVAQTRSKNELYYVEGIGKKKQSKLEE